MLILSRPHRLFSVLVVVASFTLLDGANASAEELLKLSIGTTPMNNIFNKIIKPFEKETGIKIQQVGFPNGNSGTQVFMDVDQDKAQGGAGGLPWNKWVELMKEKGYKSKTKISDFRHQVIGLDRIQILTYAGGPSKLTHEEIANLLSGKIKSWRPVNGDPHPVRIILSARQPATGKYVQDKVMNGASFAPNAETLAGEFDIAGMVKKIGTTPGAIGFGPLKGVTDDVNVPTHEVIGRPLVFMFKKPTPGMLKLFKFIKREGKKYGVAQ